MGVVVAGLRVMVGSAVARVTPASSRGCPGPPEDGSEDEPLGDRQGAYRHESYRHEWFS